jgi:hypothetical protein
VELEFNQPQARLVEVCKVKSVFVTQVKQSELRVCVHFPILSSEVCSAADSYSFRTTTAPPSGFLVSPQIGTSHHLFPPNLEVFGHLHLPQAITTTTVVIEPESETLSLHARCIAGYFLGSHSPAVTMHIKIKLNSGRKPEVFSNWTMQTDINSK